MTAVTSPRNIGHVNLDRARFFLDQMGQAEQADPFDRVAVEMYLHATIVFGKATQDWMADRYGGKGKAKHKAWLKTTPLWEDPLCSFFAKTRDVIVHEDGSVETVMRTIIHGSAGKIVISAGAGIIRVSPTNPTPRQRRKAHREHRRDLAAAQRKQREKDMAVRHILAEHCAEAEARAREHVDPGPTPRIHFVEAWIANRPAVDVVRNYLDKLEQVLEGV